MHSRPLRLSKRWSLAAGRSSDFFTSCIMVQFPQAQTLPSQSPQLLCPSPSPPTGPCSRPLQSRLSHSELHFPSSCAARCCPLSICVTPGRSRPELAGRRSVSWRVGRNCWPGPKARRGRSSDEGGVASRFRPPAEPDHGPGTCQLRGSRSSRRASLVAAWAARAAPVVGGQGRAGMGCRPAT